MVRYPPTVDRAFAALADPTRRAVLERLGSGNATISELAEPFGMSLTGMKKHIRLLEEANLVATEKVGRARRCTLVPYAFEGISTWLQRLDRDRKSTRLNSSHVAISYAVMCMYKKI